MERALARGVPFEADRRVLTPAGATKFVHTIGKPVFGEGGQVLGLFGTVADVTERKEMEAALRESRRFAESITEHSTSIIFVFDLETMSNVYSNRNVGEFLGYPVEQVQAMGENLLPQMIHPDDLPRVLSHFAQFADKADGEVVEMEYRARHAQGEWRWIWNPGGGVPAPPGRIALSDHGDGAGHHRAQARRGGRAPGRAAGPRLRRGAGSEDAGAGDR